MIAVYVAPHPIKKVAKMQVCISPPPTVELSLFPILPPQAFSYFHLPAAAHTGTILEKLFLPRIKGTLSR